MVSVLTFSFGCNFCAEICKDPGQRRWLAPCSHIRGLFSHLRLLKSSEPREKTVQFLAIQVNKQNTKLFINFGAKSIRL
jgi:hypothetical protein